MYHLDDFGLDVNERDNLVCPPCEAVAIREAGPVRILALRTIHGHEILLMLDDELRAALHDALDRIALPETAERARPLPCGVPSPVP